MMRLLTTRRAHFGWLMLMMASAILLGMLYVSTQAPSPVVTDTHQGAEIYFAAGQPAVWQDDGCVELQWRLSGISEVYINGVGTVGEQTEVWCLPPPETYRGFYRDPATAELRVRFADGEIRPYRLRVYALQPFVLRWVLPLVGVGLLAFGSVFVPSSFYRRLKRAADVPFVWEGVRWRRWGAVVALLMGVGVLGYMAYQSVLRPAYVYETSAGGVRGAITIDPPAVFQSDGCTQLSWAFDGATRVSIEGDVVDATGQMPWCLPARSTQSIVQFEYQTQEAVFRPSVAVSAMEPHIYTLVIPLLLLAAYLGRWHHALLPARWLDETRYADRLLLRPFYTGDRLSRPLMVLFIAVNVLALSNAIRHDSTLAHDGIDHFRYSLILAEGRLPTATETNQFFAPPLVYVLPSLVHRAATRAGLPACAGFGGDELACRLVGKAGQLQNVIAAVGITYLLILICGVIRPQDGLLKVHALAVLAMLPVFHRSMVYMRGELFVTLFTLLAVHRLLVMLPADRRPTWRDGAVLGLSLGLLVISRQWGVFAALGVGLWAVGVLVGRGRQGWPLWRVGLFAGGVALLSGGWFYLLTRLRLGAVTAFNRAPEETSKALEFYVGLGSGQLFVEPFRSSRLAQIPTIFYTEIWGDWWGMFYLSSLDFSVWSGMPPATALAYMARVNLLSLLPATVLLLGLGYGLAQIYEAVRMKGQQETRLALLGMVVICSLLGYLWFLASYPHSVGDTIKAMYVLQVFPLLAILSGLVLVRLRGWNEWLYLVLVSACVIVAVHNIPMMLTHATGMSFVGL